MRFLGLELGDRLGEMPAVVLAGVHMGFDEEHRPRIVADFGADVGNDILFPSLIETVHRLLDPHPAACGKCQRVPRRQHVTHVKGRRTPRAERGGFDEVPAFHFDLPISKKVLRYTPYTRGSPLNPPKGDFKDS